MPYKVGGDNLPENVKNMSASKQKQWVNVFNSAMQKYDDEAKAFKIANGVAKKTKSFTEDVWSVWEVDKRLVSQKAAEYNPFGAEGDKGCATCQWFISPNSCMLVQGDIAPGGISKFFTAASEVTDEAVPINVYVVNHDEATTKEAPSPSQDAGVSNVLKSTFDWLTRRLRGNKELQPFFVVKSNDGLQWRVFLVYSNSFKDNTGEIITEAAHKEYVEWATEKGVYPELQLWHAGPGSRWGQVDFLDYVNGFAVSSGLVDKGKEYIAEALEAQAKQDNLKVSHGYYGLKTLDGTYVLYRDFEHSPLPATAEANSWTGFALDVFKEKDMAFSPAKRQWLKDIAGFDESKIGGLEASLKQAEETLTSAGIVRKEADGSVATDAGGAASEGTPAPTAQDPMLLVVAQMKEIGGTIGNLVTIVQGNKAELDGKIAQVAAAVQTVAEQVKKSQDEIVAGAYVAAAARAPAGFVASEQNAGVVAVEAAKAAPAGDWFGDLIMHDFKNIGDEAASTPQVGVAGAGASGGS